MPIQTYAYPTPSEFRELEREYMPSLMADDPAFVHFPITERNTWRLRWRQKDNYRGMQQVRGINGEPPRVVPIGENWYESTRVYGEFIPIDEMSLTTRADTPMNAAGLPMPAQDQVDEAQEQLLVRRLIRQKTSIWALMVAGHFVIRDIKGAVVHTDGYTQQVFTSTVPWSTAATSTPLADFRAVQAYELGTSNGFGGGAVAYMNRTTATRMGNNTNAADLGGKRGTGGGTIMGLAGWNTVLAAEGMPRVQVYNEGYHDDDGVFQLQIPDNKVVVVGTRPGVAAVGEYSMVINANNPGRAPGSYTVVADSADGPHPIPRNIEVHDGHNGGCFPEYPSMLVLMNV